MRFAVFTASLPEWQPEEAARQVADAGYDGIEWRVTDQAAVTEDATGFWSGNRCTWPQSSFADDVPAIKQVTTDAGLDMPSVGSYVKCHDLDRVDYTLGAVAALGVRQVRISMPGYDDQQTHSGQWDTAHKDYAEVERLAARHGVRALVEVHHGTLTFSPHAAKAFVADFDPQHVGVIHDVGNMVHEGWTPYRLGFEVLGEHLAHVHVKNGAWHADGTRPDGSTAWKAGWAPMREGQADFAALFAALRTVGYDGWVSVEDFSEKLPLAERIRDNLDLLRTVSTAS